MKPYAGSDFEKDRGFTKKDLEHQAIQGFLRRLGLSGFEICLSERPDALIDFSDTDGSIRLGCEIQTLQSDQQQSGSELRQFHSRWVRIMERVLMELRGGDTILVPYCTVSFRDQSYSCLKNIADERIVEDLVSAGRRLQATRSVKFPDSEMPALSSLLTEIRVVDADGDGILWWPTHLQSGVVPNIDSTIVKAVQDKAKLGLSFDWREANERLLLLIAEGRGLTDIIGYAREIALPVIAEFPFTWVVVWDKFSENIWGIYPEHAIICDDHQKLRILKAMPSMLQRFVTAGDLYMTKVKKR